MKWFGQYYFPYSPYCASLTNKNQETSSLPDWGKVSFRDYPPKKWEELLPHSSESARQLVSELVKYQSTDRLKASEVSLEYTLIILEY